MIGKKHPVVATVCSVVVIVAAVLFLIRHQQHRQPRTTQLNTSINFVLGEVTGSETARLLGPRGQLIVVTADGGPSPIPPAEAQLQGLRQGLNTAGGFQIVATEKVPFTTIFSDQTFGIDVTTYRRIVQDHPDADAIVSLVGAPLLSQPDIARLPQRLPKFVAVFGLGFRNPELKNAFANQLVQLAIVPRTTPPAETHEARTPREWFDRCFLVITPDNTPSLLETPADQR